MTFTIRAIGQRATWTRQTPLRHAALEPRLAPDAEAEQMTNGCAWRADPVLSVMCWPPCQRWGGRFI
jgi:hypothetical protein